MKVRCPFCGKYMNISIVPDLFSHNYKLISFYECKCGFKVEHKYNLDDYSEVKIALIGKPREAQG